MVVRGLKRELPLLQPVNIWSNWTSARRERPRGRGAETASPTAVPVLLAARVELHWRTQPGNTELSHTARTASAHRPRCARLRENPGSARGARRDRLGDIYGKLRVVIISGCDYPEALSPEVVRKFGMTSLLEASVLLRCCAVGAVLGGRRSDVHEFESKKTVNSNAP